MPVAVTVTRIKFDRLAEPSAALMSLIGQAALRIQAVRILDGIGSDDQRMTTPSKTPNAKGTYSQDYSDIRQFGQKQAQYVRDIDFKKQYLRTRRGKVRKTTFGGNRTVDVRNLSMSGAMLKARIIKAVTASTVVLGWVTGIEAQKASWNDAMTPFVKISPKDRSYLIAQTKSAVIQQIAKNLARARAEKGVQP